MAAVCLLSRTQVQAWLQQAANDLLSARILLGTAAGTAGSCGETSPLQREENHGASGHSTRMLSLRSLGEVIRRQKMRLMTYGTQPLARRDDAIKWLLHPHCTPCTLVAVCATCTGRAEGTRAVCMRLSEATYTVPSQPHHTVGGRL